MRPPAEIRDPVSVLIVQEAWHSGLVLPRADGTRVEYGYGDWDWYALGHDSWYHVFDTLLWPTQGALARREVPAGTDLGTFYGAAETRSLAVERERVAALLSELDAAWHARLDTRRRHPEYRTDFVHAEDGFWFLHNCHDVTAGWLRRLGCSVSWVPIRGGLAVARSVD